MKQHKSPLISVIMGVYNGEKTLRRAVNSIVKQSFKDFEFIICDDCSTDNSYATLLELQKEDHRIIILRNDTNCGLAATLNRCISKARGKYIARMDDDDISHIDRFKCQFDFLENNNEYSIVGCRRNTFDSNGIWATTEFHGPLSSQDIISGNIFTHPTVMIRKEDLNEVGGYTVSPRTKRGQDFDLWCKMYTNGFKGYILNQILFDYYEDRKTLKEPSIKTRYYNFKTHKIWRSKMGLPLRYDIYAWKEILAGILPNKLLVYYKQLKNR